MNKRVLALGRMKAGAMNKTEAAYATTLEAAKNAQEIVWYAFEGVTLKPELPGVPSTQISSELDAQITL